MTWMSGSSLGSQETSDGPGPRRHQHLCTSARLFLLPESAQSSLGLSNIVLDGLTDIAVSFSKNAASWEALLLDSLTPGPFDTWQGAGAHQSVRFMQKGQKNIAEDLAHSSLNG